jgi:hypothetical protein
MQVLSTVSGVMSWMARYAGGSVPQESDTQFGEWLSWIGEGQEDMAERGFWSRLLTSDDFDISADEPSAVLPEDFHKRNGIFVLDVNGVDWNEANNSAGQKLFVNKNAEGEWVVYFKGFTPTEDVTATLWYFRHPGVPTAIEDILALDGKAAGFYALAEYFRQAGELGSLDDARTEYNNRFEEALGLEMLPSPQELLSWKPYTKFANTPNERNYYSRGRGRRV